MTLVLVPGFMTDPDLWQDVEGGLQGLGPTFHADLSRDGSIPAMAQRALADAPTSFILIGFSMGGYVAREMARLAPDRVQALVLIATTARGETALQAKRKAATAAMVAASPAVSLSRSSIALSLHPDRAGDQALVARIQAMGARAFPCQPFPQDFSTGGRASLAAGTTAFRDTRRAGTTAAPAARS
jgi:pimeloyl-ACP methyl ester carboxylesterase